MQITSKPLVLAIPGLGGTERMVSASGNIRELVVSDNDPIALPAHINEVLLQNRRCGDFYAEIHAGKRCAASVNADPLAAVKSAIAQVAA